MGFCDLRQPYQGRAARTTRNAGQPDEVPAVLLTVDAHMIAGHRRDRRCGSVDQLPPQVLGLQHLAELLDAPVGDQELQARSRSQPPVAVVAEDPDHAGPDLRHVLARYPAADALSEHRIGGQPAADPQIKAGPMFGVDHPDEGDIVDLGCNIVIRHAGERSLELAGQVGELRVSDVALDDVANRRARIDDLLGRNTGDRRPDDDPWAIPASFGCVQAYRLEPPPDLGHVLNADPVQLDVLPVGHVCCVTAELDRDLADDPQLFGGQCTTVDADSEHEVLVVELPRLQRRGLTTVDTGPALGVEAIPAKASAQVRRVDRSETALGVDVLDPLAHEQRIVVLLRLLILVEGLAIAERPLTLTLLSSGALS